MISNEEFQIMVGELLESRIPSYDMLIDIADKTLTSWVKKWCSENYYLRGRGCEEDIMQDIHLRLITTVIPKFLLRDGVSGPVNYDPKGFGGWLYTVGHNIVKDHAERICNNDFRFGELYDNIPEIREIDVETSEEAIEKLKEAFSIAIASNKRVYIVLTWVSEYIFMINLDISKIRANEMVLMSFSDKTLFEMNDMLTAAAKKIPWLSVTDEQKNILSAALNKKLDEERVFGEVKYSEFLMKMGGKKAISDWMNRMNNYIKRVMKNGTSEN